MKNSTYWLIGALAFTVYAVVIVLALVGTAIAKTWAGPEYADLLRRVLETIGYAAIPCAPILPLWMVYFMHDDHF